MFSQPNLRPSSRHRYPNSDRPTLLCCNRPLWLVRRGAHSSTFFFVSPHPIFLVTDNHLLSGANMTGLSRQSPVDLPTGVARHLTTPARPAPYNSAMRCTHGTMPPGGSPFVVTTALPSPVDTSMSGQYMPDIPQQPPTGGSSALFGGHVTSLDSPPRSNSSLTATSHIQYSAPNARASPDMIEDQF